MHNEVQASMMSLCSLHLDGAVQPLMLEVPQDYLLRSFDRWDAVALADPGPTTATPPTQAAAVNEFRRRET